MSNPDEIVCESVPKFWGECERVHRVRLYGLPSREGDSVTVNGKTVVYRPTPPRDEAREAFREWSRGRIIPCDVGGFESAFLAGRASASPFDGKRIRAQEWNSTLVTVSHMDEVRGVPGLVDRLLSMRVEVPK